MPYPQTLDELTAAWQERHSDAPPEARRLSVKVLHLLADGEPLSAQKLADNTDLSIETATEILEKSGKAGAQVDEQGRLVGNALTQKPTPHHFDLDGKHLYAWCSLDTLFLPGLLGQTAHIESSDPINGDTITLTIGPDGIQEPEDPSQIYLSVFVPGMDVDGCCTPEHSGPQSAACSTMHFFSSRQSAEQYVQSAAATVVVTAQEAFELARKVWLEPYHAALREAS